MPDIIVLNSSRSSFCKRFYKKAAEIKSEGAPNVLYFNYECRSVEDIKGFAAVLSELEQDATRMLVRGQVADDVDVSKPIRRRQYRQDRSQPNESPFLDVAAPWIMIDVDKLPLPASMSVTADPDGAIKHAISLLPAEFHDVSVYWQLSGSAGVYEDNVVSAHLFYWLDDPVPNELLRRWANEAAGTYSKRLIDPAVFTSMQPHYIASPIFGDGIDDPFKGTRSGLIEKAQDSVSLIVVASPVSRTSDSTVQLDEDRARGFGNILATLGDHEGGAGFNSPLLRSVASFVSKVGGKDAEAQTETLKERLRKAIDEADQSAHSANEVERYSSDQYLDGLIGGAIDKYGDSSALPPYFKTVELSLEQGEKELEKAISGFAKELVKYGGNVESALLMDTPTIAIKATAGLGKTSRIIKQLIKEAALKLGDVHYFVPNHRLSKELVADLEAELNFDLPPSVVEALSDGDSVEGVYSRVRLISGRGQQGSNGKTMCLKNDLAQKIARAGQQVSSTLCKSGSSRCEYYNVCGYQAQFEKSGVEVPTDDPDSEMFWEVAVMTHSHMFLNTKDRLHPPGLIVVDESFYQSSIRTEDVKPTELYQTNKPISRLLYDAIVSRKPQLLDCIRQEGYTADDLDEEAITIEADIANEAGKQITPAMDEATQMGVLRSSETKRKASLILRQLAAEMRATDRAISHSVYYDGSADKIVVTSRADMTIPADIPTVFIDADIQPEILKLFRDDVEIKEIPVERKATVHQFIDLTFSKTALLSDGNKSETLLEQAKAFAVAVAAKGATLLVCSKAVRVQITGEQGARVEQDCLWEGVTVTHFGSLRGVNKYEDYDNVIILGREQPMAIACEKQARALWWDADDPLTLLERKKGDNKPLEQVHRGYRVAGGEHSSVQVQIHPDHRVQLLLEQIRECETTQALDRLRLLRDNAAGTARQVFILSSVPVDITVDHLWGWKKLQSLLALGKEADGVLPLNPKHMMIRCPGAATSIRAAERYAKEAKEAKEGKKDKAASFLISIYIRDVAVYTVTYRTHKQRRPSEALVWGENDTTKLSSSLSAVAGEAVEVLSTSRH